MHILITVLLDTLRKYGLLAILSIVILFSIKTCSNYRSKLAVSDMNVSALSDTLQILRKGDQTIYEKRSLAIFDFKDVKDASIKEAIKANGTKNRDVREVIIIKSVIDTIIKIDTVFNDSITILRYKSPDIEIELGIDSLLRIEIPNNISIISKYQKEKRSGLFGFILPKKKYIVINVANSNKLLKINDIKSVIKLE